jgi:hypothetical protein
VTDVIVMQDRVHFLGLRARTESFDSDLPEPPLESLPGEFAKDAILDVAASAFDVSRADLARALSQEAIVPAHRHHDPAPASRTPG